MYPDADFDSEQGGGPNEAVDKRAGILADDGVKPRLLLTCGQNENGQASLLA